MLLTFGLQAQIVGNGPGSSTDRSSLASVIAPSKEGIRKEIARLFHSEINTKGTPLYDYIEQLKEDIDAFKQPLSEQALADISDVIRLHPAPF